MTISQRLERYRKAFEGLTPDTLDDLTDLVAENIIFSDPFNHVTGRDQFRRIFAHMFATCDNPRFVVTDAAIGEKAAYLRWQMTGQFKGKRGKAFSLTGMSEVHFDANGAISQHIDHWDSASQLLSDLPYIGWITRRILRLFRLK
jgi:ketosteroid isomerase-like protein